MSRLWLHTASRHPDGPHWLHANCGEDLPSKVLADNYFGDPDQCAHPGDWIMARCAGGDVTMLLVVTSVKPIRTALIGRTGQGIMPGRRRS